MKNKLRKIYLLLLSVCAFGYLDAQTAPTVNASGITTVGASTTSISINWNSGNGSNRIVTICPHGTNTNNPFNSVTYVASSTYGYGSAISTNNYCVYNGSSYGTTIFGLAVNTRYTIRIYEYNTNWLLGPQYLTSGAPSYHEYTLATQPTTQASVLKVDNITSTTAQFTFTAGSGSYNLLSLIEGATYANVPADGTDYYASTYYGYGDPITGTSPYAYVLADAASTTINVSYLAAGTTYTAGVFTYNGVSGANNYNTSFYPTKTFTTIAAEPTSISSTLSFTNITDNSMIVSCIPSSSGGGTYRIITCKAGTSNTDLPQDTEDYTASTVYGLGEQIGGSSGAYVVYNGTGNSVKITGLSATTNYSFRVYEYNVASNVYNKTYNYLTTNSLSGIQQTLAVEPTVAPSNIVFSNITSSSVRATWANGNEARRVVGVAAGRKQAALAFDGVNDYVSIPSEANFDFTNQMTVEAWIKVNSFTSADQAIITKGSDSWSLTRNGSTNSLKFSISSTFFLPYTYSALGTRDVNDGQWHHVAGVLNGSQILLYVDGALDGFTSTWLGIDNSTYPVYIGANAAVAGKNFSGQIDEVRIWSVAQTLTSIRNNMNKTLVGNETGLKGYWKLDDGFASTTTANNSSFTTGLNATLYNFNSSAAASSFTATSGWVHSGAIVNQPLDFATYTDNAAFMINGSSSFYYGSVHYVVYRGPDSTSVTVTNLSPSTYYTFSVVGFNGTLGNNNYLTNNYAIAEVQTSAASVPTITSFAPTFGFVGSVVTITGTNFNPVAANNVVYFGATRATVLTANVGGTQLTVKVPSGATYSPISVTNNTLTAYSTKPYTVTSPCGSTVFSGTSFNTATAPVSYYVNDVKIADIDLDGWPDILGMYQYGYLAVTRNTSTSTGVSFASLPNYFYNAATLATDIEVADFDGDGRLDVVNSNTITSNGTFMVMRNTSTIANISFAVTTSEFAAAPGYTVSDVIAADFDRDGKTDIMVSYSNNVVSYFRNISSIGNIQFSGRTDVTLAVGCVATGIAVGDIDGNGAVDVAIAGGTGAQMYYLRNTSTVGNISFAAYTSTVLAGTINSVTIGDIDNDNKPEILYGNGTNTVNILKNTSSVGAISTSTLTSLTTLANTPIDVRLGDLDGDGKADVVVGYSTGTQVSIFKNNSTSSVSVATKYDFTVASSGTNPVAVAIGDLNGDSKADIISAANGNFVSYFQNNINALASEPTVQASNLVFSAVTTTSATLTFTPGNGANKVVFVRAATTPGFIPADGVSYVPNTTFGSGTDLGNGNYCVFDGNGSGVTVTGLLSNTAYVFSVYEYNGVLNCQYNYLPAGTTNSATQTTNNNAPTLDAIADPTSICQDGVEQTINLSGITTGAGNETQTLIITATSSNIGLIPNPTVTYTSPNATGTLKYTPVNGVSGTAVITVTVNDGADNSNTIVRQFTVTVDNNPTTADAGSNQVLCTSVATMAANTPAYGTGTWAITYTSNGSITITNPNNPTTTVNGFVIGDSVRLSWTINNGNCASSQDFVTLKRNSCPTSADFTVNSSTECLNGSPTVTFTDNSVGSGAPIVTWNWSFGAGAFPPTATGQGPHTVTYTTPGAKTIVLYVEDNLAEDNTKIKTGFVTITDVPEPATNISGTTTVCQGQNGVTYSVPAISGATGYTWNLPSGATLISGVNTNNITVNYGTNAVSGNISVRGTNSCGNGTLSANFAVTVNPLPSAAGIISGLTTVCEGANGVTYSVPAIANANSNGYHWTVPPGAIIMSGATTNSITVNYAMGSGDGAVTVYASNACGDGALSSIDVTVNHFPDAADLITGQNLITTCPSSTGVIYSIPLVNNATSYDWTVPSGATITDGAGTNQIVVSYGVNAVSGNIEVTPQNTCGDGASSTLSVVVNRLPEMAGFISGEDSLTVCPASNGIVYTIPAAFNASFYKWTVPSGATIVSGDSTTSITVNFADTAESGIISVYAGNDCGNGLPSNLPVYVSSVPTQEICMVTVDNTSKFNKILWERTVSTAIDSFRIYRETASGFVHIGSVDYAEPGEYVDSTYLPKADPNLTNYRYKISVIDTCGNESVLSTFHRTIFLQANQGVSGVVNLSWVPYDGATVSFYRILRDTTGTGNFVVYDSVPGSNTVYTDVKPPSTVNNVVYVLESNWATSCNPSRASINTTRSNIKSHEFVSDPTDVSSIISTKEINVYPNPTVNEFTIEYPSGFKKYNLQLFDALGQLVYSEQLMNADNVGAMNKTQVNVADLPKGIYIVNLQIDNASFFKRIITQ